jgi:hypothetical protein
MLPIALCAGMSVEALQAAMTMLTKLARRWRKTGRKRALYRYLTTLFRIYAAWKRDDTRTAASRIAKLTGLRTQLHRHPVRTIIDATSTADRKSKSRWTQALRFAWRERSKWKCLEQCLRANRGVSGCASRWADMQAETRAPAGYVRVGGEDRVPKIPFFVGVEMIDQYGNWC